jgi:hypothetical protein
MQMIKWFPDIVAKVRFKTPEEGGKKKLISPIEYKIPFCVNDYISFDCVLLLDQIGLGIIPGKWMLLPIAFVAPWLVKMHLSPGDKFRLREFGFVADGEVVSIVPPLSQIGLKVIVKVADLGLEGVIVNIGKDKENHLRAIVKLDKSLSFNNKTSYYIMTQDNHNEYWPESFLGHPFPCNIVVLTEKEVKDHKIIEKDIHHLDMTKGNINLREDTIQLDKILGIDFIKENK